MPRATTTTTEIPQSFSSSQVDFKFRFLFWLGHQNWHHKIGKMSKVQIKYRLSSNTRPAPKTEYANSVEKHL